MIGSRAWFALMRRNMIYRKRHFVSSFFELLLPVFFIWILIAIKNAAQSGGDFETETIPASFPLRRDTVVPLSFHDYVTALQAKRICVEISPEEKQALQQLTQGLVNVEIGDYYVSGMLPAGLNWMVPLVKCDSRKCKQAGQPAHCEYSAIGVAGADTGGKERANDFITWLYTQYPELQPNSTAFDNNNNNNLQFDLIQTFGSTENMDEYVTSRSYGSDSNKPKLSMGIVFTGNDPDDYSYTLRQNATGFNSPENEARPASLTTPDTSTLTNNFAKTDDDCLTLPGAPYLGPLQFSCTGQYLYNGILTFQRLVNDFVLSDSGSTTFVSEAGVQFVPFPTRPYEEAGFYSSLQDFGPLIITLGLLFPVAAMISYIAKEKELRQKELMKMMSITESDIGWSWFVTFMIFNIITATLVAMVSDELYEKSEFSLLWIFWVLVFLCIVVFCMTIAATTSKSTRAVLIGLLVFFAGSFLTISVSIEDGNVGQITLISLHPVAAFSYGLAQIGKLEENGIGLTANSVDLSENKSGYAFTNCISSLIIDSIFWGVLCWYLNRVITPDYGQAEPFYFPFSPSYWCPGRRAQAAHDPSREDAEAVARDLDGIPYEPVSDALKRQSEEGKSIEIRHLRKQFGEKTAVDGLSLSMYSGQITALLGHNGAGKTTTINMLTGAMAPTEGHAFVAGRDIQTDMQAIRQDIGICLQHDCLFPQLTVREHIRFFARLKGLYSRVSKKEAELQIDQAIRDVALYEKRNTYSRNLSGGMKRKLSVAIAFSGGSKVVLLDEPTSGMDPFSRRFTWNVIRQYRQDRCIILTTHFMDEADILGDRIAIMAEGQLRCAGTSLFLKKTYGVGYQLTIEKSQESHVKGNGSDKPSNPDLIEAKSQGEGLEVEKKATFVNSSEHLYDLVQSAVPEANLLNDTGSEIRYQLPMGSSANFPTMFQGLDEETDNGTIQSYGVSMTTLDEVFLLVARGESAEKQAMASSRRGFHDGTTALADVDGSEKSARSRMDLEKEGLFFRHVAALTKKRAANFSRDKKAWCCTTVVPSLFVLVGFIIFTFGAANRNLEPITLTMQDLNEDVTKAPVNPVPYNSPDNPFTCQPGTCAFDPGLVVSEETGEIYTFCGLIASLGFQINPDDLYGSAFNPSNKKCTVNGTSDIMNKLSGDGVQPLDTNVTGVLEAAYSLYNTSHIYTASQYGAVFFTHDTDSIIVEDGENYNETVVTQCEDYSVLDTYRNANDCKVFGGVGYVVQYNFTALHSAPLYQALADEALARKSANRENLKIKVTIAPFPLTKIEEGFAAAEDGFSAWFLVVLSFPFIAGAFGTFVVLERQSKAKHLQTVAGVEPSAYWISSFIWDTINYQVPLWITVILMFIFNVSVLTTSERDVFSGIVAILFFFGPAAAGFTYCVSFAFSSASLCNMVVITGGFLIGMGGPLTVFILTLLSADPNDPRPNLETAATVLTWVLRLTPPFCLGKGIFNAINIDTFVILEADDNLSAWSEPVLLYEVIFLIAECFVYVALAIQIDIWSTNPSIVNLLRCNFFRKRSEHEENANEIPDDSDVVQEAERVNSGGANNDLIVLSQISKIYSNGKKAVNNLSLGIPPGECFGLLGINGAGKTTTMGILTAEFPPSSGDATLAGYSVTREPQKTRRRIGYCPQFDAHFTNMTGREHVELYASIKGVPQEFVKEAAAAKLNEVGLSEKDSDRLCANYSGGMKRRLSLAIATIGSPQIVFLDECSTGVDPVARREIWGLISGMVSAKNVLNEERTSVILTTHSMEECEALCPRIGIMANGKLRCLGSAQRLKNKFGQGYQVEIKIKIVEDEDEDYKITSRTLLSFKGVNTPVEEESRALESTFFESTFFNLTETQAALRNLTGDDFLSNMVDCNNEIGYNIWKEATSIVGVPLDALAAFACSEVRMRNVDQFLDQHFPNHVLRERQDLKARYEVSAAETRISDIFARIEESKEALRLSDYGVSQTSLEQVFNMHAAEAEKLKLGGNDG